MPEFATDSGAIFYEVIERTPQPGDEAITGAETLTLLHNFMSTGRTAWGPLVDELSRHYRILLPDLPGHGRSLGHPQGYEHHAIARQLAGLLHAEGAAGGHLAGCSSGGMLGQLLVHHRLVTPATLTLVSTTYSVNPKTTGSDHALVPEHFQAARNWLDATARLHDPNRYEGYFAQELLPGFRRLTAATAIDLPIAALADFWLPLCIIHGERDEFFPRMIPVRMAATAPDAELHLIPQQTHALLFRRPWQVAQIMVEFLCKHPS
jgi:pimeloyl-ACP methyl ester carboxylesterase